MRILILTGSDAPEETAALQQVESGLVAEGWECLRRNSRDFVACCLPRLLAGRLCRMEKNPRSCRRGHSRKILSNSARELRLYLEQETFDAILCTQVLGGLLLTEALRQHPLPVKTCLVTLGDNCRPGTELCDLDSFVVTREELIPLFTARGIPTEKILCRQSPKGA